MAASQVRQGRVVAAFDLSTNALDAAVAQGCERASSIAHAVDGADAIITMLPAGPQMCAAFEDAILQAAPQAAVLIDCSTVDVESARSVAHQARAAGYVFADAPVSGGVAAALSGQLTFMVGCAPSDFNQIEAALRPMAKAIIRAGEAGAGQAAKICNNMLLGISMIGVCEAFALAERLDLDAERFFEIASISSGQCWSLTSYCPVAGVGPKTPADVDYTGGFSTALMLKDLKLAQAAAAQAGAVTPLGGHAEALYALMARLGYGDKDFSAVLQLLRGKPEALA
jgi:3-hydroxyisobutyrate dehydrogenase